MVLRDLPDLDWSSNIRAAMHADAALRIGNDHDDEDAVRTSCEREALAYWYAAWVVEEEISDGRAGETLQVAGDVFLAELWRLHNLPEDDRPSF